SHDGPKNVIVRWRPWLAIRAIAGDSVQNFDHRALPVPSSAAMRSNAVPRGPEARPRESRDNARRIASGSAPHCTAIDNTIAESRALVSAALLLLWLLRNSSAIEPSGNQPTVHVERRPATVSSKVSASRRLGKRWRVIRPPSASK